MAPRLCFPLLLVALLAPAGGAVADAGDGQFNVTCRWARTATEDPIVSPGSVDNSHLHTFFGNHTIRPNSTPESLRVGPQGCNRFGDGSAYWVPAVYGRSPQDSQQFTLGPGRLTPPAPGGRAFLYPISNAVAYYRTAGRNPGTIRPFPPGLVMIAGNAGSQGPQSTAVVSWKCVTGEIVYEDRALIQRLRRDLVLRRRALRALPRGARGPTAKRIKETKDALARARSGDRQRAGCVSKSQDDYRQLELAVRFPDCWDGRRLDSLDHQSHMAYATRRRRGAFRVCPSSHPVAVPKLTFNVRYSQPFATDVMLASGPSFTAHADFMNGWNEHALADLVSQCLNADVFCGRF